MGQLTARQVHLFFEQAQYRRHRNRADLIADVNAGTNGGSEVSALIRQLRQED